MTSRLKRAVTLVLIALVILVVSLREQIGLLYANRRPDTEAGRLAEEFGLRGHEVLAEVGAGTGRLTVAIAQKLPHGRVYATELDDGTLDELRRTVAAAGLLNVEVRSAQARATNLPDACCDVVFMRTVYHHFHDPRAMLEELSRALTEQGRLAIIEFEPRGMWRLLGSPAGTPERGGHGIPRDMLTQEVTGSGRFTVEKFVADWFGPLYLVVFRRVQGK